MTALLPDRRGDRRVVEEAVDPDDAVIRLDPVVEAVAALRAGLPVLVVDDADRENEGDVILAAVHTEARWMGWTIRHTSGVLCAAMPDELADRLHLPPMVEHNEDAKQTAYTVSVDARRGITTGIGATDRAVTVRLLADPGTEPGDLVRPGHVFPLRARAGGVLTRRGHTEAAVDLCRLAGLPPVGVLAEVVGDDGEPTRLPGLRRLADEHDLPLISIADLAVQLEGAAAGAGPITGEAAAGGAGVASRLRDGADGPLRARPGRGPRVQRVADTVLPTAAGDFRALGYRDLATGDAHVALVGGTPPPRDALVRVHSECLTGDAFGSRRCDCGPQLQASLEAVAAEGGVVVYLSGHEGRGIGLLAKLTAYGLQDHGLDTVAANLEQGLPADAREYGAAAAVLRDLGLDGIRLLTNNPGKVDGLRRHGIQVSDRRPLVVGQSEHNRAYLQAKRDLMGHALPMEVSDER
jgi:3,4-dihydroxy 2-butanone 4-phosphate synthase/GTP cyclohydrolase II